MRNHAPWSIAIAAALAAGCSGGKSSLSISSRARAPLGTGAAAAPASPAVTVKKVHLVIRKLELQGVDAGGKKIEAEAGPIPVDITDFSTPPKLSAGNIPAGDYTQLEMEIGDIVVTVSEGGPDFDFKTSIEVEQEVCGTFKVVSGGNLNFTLAIDVSKWFTDPKDPTKQLSPSDPNNRGAIEENIARSFEMFEDNDGDGKDDDCECETEDGGSSGGGSSLTRSSSDSSGGGSGCSCSTACAPPPTTCQPNGGSCTSTADCCTGTTPPLVCLNSTCQPNTGL